MTARNKITIEAIYQDGIIKPLEPLDLPDKARVRIQVTQQSQPTKGSLAKYKGILAGQGDFSLAEIQNTVQSTVEDRLKKLSSKLNDDTK